MARRWCAMPTTLRLPTRSCSMTLTTRLGLGLAPTGQAGAGMPVVPMAGARDGEACMAGVRTATITGTAGVRAMVDADTTAGTSEAGEAGAGTAGVANP